MRSLRFRLPVLFLAAIALSGIVATAIAFRLFQSYTHAQSVAELRREAHGLTRLYAQISGTDVTVRAANLEAASGNWIYYVGESPQPGSRLTFRTLPRSAVDWKSLSHGKIVQFEFTPPGVGRRYIA